MKKVFSILITSATAAIMSAQTLNVNTQSGTIQYDANVTNTLGYDKENGSITIDGASYKISDITNITIDEPLNSNIPSVPVAASTNAAKRLYTYFKLNYGQKVISSVMADINWNTKLADKVNTLIRKYPAMNCFDFIHIYVPENNWINYNDITPVTNWADAGGIVQLMWHFNVPVNEATASDLKTDGSGVTCTPSETSFKAANALVDGT